MIIAILLDAFFLLYLLRSLHTRVFDRVETLQVNIRRNTIIPCSSILAVTATNTFGVIVTITIHVHVVSLPILVA